MIVGAGYWRGECKELGVCASERKGECGVTPHVPQNSITAPLPNHPRLFVHCAAYVCVSVGKPHSLFATLQKP